MTASGNAGTSGSRGFPLAERRRRRDPGRIQRLRRVIRYMLERGTLAKGDQVMLATHFKLSRQRVHQLVQLEREAIEQRTNEDDGASDTGVIGEATS